MSDRLAPLLAFEDLCREQGVRVDSGLLISSHMGLKPVAPDGLYAAVVAAGRRLSDAPPSPLVSGAVETPDDPQHILNIHPAGRALLKIVNASIEPLLPIPPDRAFTNSTRHYVGMCDLAERAFAWAALQLDQPKQPLESYGWFGCQIVTDECGAPIAIRKSVGEPSTLTLAEVLIDNVPYPAGSFCEMALVGEDDIEVPQDECMQVGWERVGTMRFRRMSAYAVDPKRRQSDFGVLLDTYGAQVESLAAVQSAEEGLTLADITALARVALGSIRSLE